MRTLFTAFILVLLVNALALGGLAAWLAASDRLSRDRVLEAVAGFENTFDEQSAIEAEEAEVEQEARALAERALRLEQVAGGPMTPETRLGMVEQVDDSQRALLSRQQSESQALMRQINSQRSMIESMIADLEARQAAFDRAVEERLTEMQDEDFREAVAMLEGIPPRQAKQVLQELLDQGSQEQVVDYLAAMEQRRASSVLREFKTPNEIEQAAELIEMLRQRTDSIAQEARL